MVIIGSSAPYLFDCVDSSATVHSLTPLRSALIMLVSSLLGIVVRRMFESLSDKLKRTLKNLRGEGVLTREHVDAALREIRLALLEADVNYKVAKDFIASVKEKAEGQQVWLELKPSEQVVKIVFDELVELLGGQSSRLVFTKQIPNTVMVVGLQGSGK